ncbi:DUF7260 family protein [Natrarchaeobaculum sulfurireducens]|uniref:DUF7260 domain-containing protein n=1 Tax=Natrarchaeobaculum sulfurireducens TaxID=2044521 RepID=A0A346PJK7_9EURY|nr:hypothetical protein [Natrarchaeobaculum sulfurireducens]AXR79702.1 hypothetical protein AArc1_3409 [Natrarchaeobaculum sulfurireducens]AXR83443.1 hypothetical protein AArcMg_3469 [Natrarchaeobaculum sulfurireducens]
MTVRTPVHESIDRVADEREHLEGYLTAIDRFASGVRELSVSSPSNSAATPRRPDGGVVLAGRSRWRTDQPSDRCEQVRDLFADTIYPYSVADLEEPEPLLETIAEEFGTDVAVALSPATDSQFSPTVKRATLAATSDRRDRCLAFQQAVAREADSLESAALTVESITDWLARADETPLLNLDFDALRTRHETLTEHRERCRALLADRQLTLQRTASHHASAGVRQRSVTEYLYSEFPSSYPVLSTTLRLEGVCAACQRAVRDHLTRRV